MRVLHTAPPFLFLGLPTPFHSLGGRRKGLLARFGAAGRVVHAILGGQRVQEAAPAALLLAPVGAMVSDFQRVGMRTGYLVARLKFGSPGHQW